MIDTFLDTIPKHLMSGKSISLGRLGIFRLSVSSDGAATPEEFNANMISNIRVLFRPSVELRNKIRQAKFEKA